MTSRTLAHAMVRAAVPVGGVALMLAALPTLPAGAHAADQFVAVALLATGSIAWLVGRHLQGLCAVLAGGALAAIGNVDANSGSATLRGLAIAGGPLVIPLAAAAVGWHGRWSWLALAGGVLAGPVRSLVYDPFLDPHCLVCRPSAAAVVHHPGLARALLLVGLVLTVAALLLAAARTRTRWVLVSMAAITSSTLWRPDLRLVACVIAIALLGVDIIRILAAQYRIRVLVDMLRQDVDLEQTLRRTLGDPELTVAYCVDEDNEETPAPASLPTSDPSGQRVSTELSIDGRLVAVIRHNPAAVEVGELATALDGSARLALDNERQTARLEARAREVQRSRVRIVERADSERRRLERDVHDGAQQHVLALGFDLRIALAGLTSDAPSHGVLEQCLQETMGALDDLRDLSHGLYPPSLDTGGLVPALRALARRAQVPVTIVNMSEARLPATVERTVFAIVADAADRARSELSLTIASATQGVEVVIHGDTEPPAQAVVDRLATLGGTLISSDTTIRAVIPCE